MSDFNRIIYESCKWKNCHFSACPNFRVLAFSTRSWHFSNFACNILQYCIRYSLMNIISKDASSSSSCFRKSERIVNRPTYSRNNVVDSSLLNHLQTFSFIDPPIIVTKASDGSQHATWNGIRKAWNDSRHKWGVKTTKS